MRGIPDNRSIDLIILMAPPGSGKSTLGNELNRQRIASYTELEPMLVQRYGEGEKFTKHRNSAHLWIWEFYRSELRESTLPVVMETTGIAGRDFIEEMCGQYKVLFIRLDTPRALCLERVRNRPKARNINQDSEALVVKFYDDWHANVAPTYDFGLSVSGTDLAADASLVRREIAKD